MRRGYQEVAAQTMLRVPASGPWFSWDTRIHPTGDKLQTLAVLIAAICVLVPHHALGQDAPVRPNGHLLPLQVDTFAIYTIRGSDTTRTGVLIDALQSTDGRLVRTYRQIDRMVGPQLDTITSTFPDLRPVAYQGLSARFGASLTYRSDSVRGSLLLADGSSVSVGASLSRPVYDGASYDLVVRASDLAEGVAITVPLFLVAANATAEVSGRVIGSEVIRGRDCWVFTANFAGMPVTFWIDKSTRALRRQLLQPGVGLGVLFEGGPPSRESVEIRPTIG
jgi:hypothetical protein